MRRFLTKGALALGIVTLACSSGDLTGPDTTSTGTNNTPTTVTITPPASPDIVVGTSVNLVVAVKNASGQDISGLTIAWSSSDATVASITQAGVVTGVKIGSAVITGTVGTKSASLAVNVIPVPVKTVAVTLKNALIVGETATGSFIASDASGNALTGRTVVWSSRNNAIASISAAGVVTAVAVGTTTIDATVGGVIGSATVTVSPVPPAPVKTVNVTLKSALVVAEIATASASTLDASGNTLSGRAVVWSSRNAAVASVSAAGVVTAVGAGTTTIDATSEGIVGSATVVVTVPLAPVQKVTLTFNFIETLPGQAIQGTAVTTDASGNVLTGRAISWSSARPAVATVSALGVVTGVDAGTTIITATSEGVSATATITVYPLLTAVASVAMTASPTTITIGHTTTAIVSLRDAAANVLIGRTIDFTSSNPAVASVANTGIITGLTAGTATITASAESRFATVLITVIPPPVVGVTVSAPALKVQPTLTLQASALLKDIDNNTLTGRVVTWSSSNTAAATVNAAGLITGVASGSTTITATSESITGTLTISVPPVATINVTAVATTLQPTQTTQASAALLDASTTAVTNRTVVWTSTNTAAATVNANGLVTAVASGTTQIKATSEGINGTVTITIPPVASVVVTPAANFLLVAATTQMSAVPKDAASNALTNRTITWSSATPAVATINASGLVTAVGTGTTVISATSETIVGTFTLTVVPPVGSIQVSATKNALLLDETANVSALIFDTFGAPVNNIPPVWSSSNAAKATVTQGGLVTAVNGGTYANVTISATAGGVTTSTIIAVTGHVAEPTISLPATFLNTVAPLAPDVGGVIRSVNSTATFNAAITAANPGDVIELANNVTYTGNFLFPNKGNATKWITIRPANFASLPAEGSRMTPTIAASLQLPILRSPNNEPAIGVAASANHYRFIGLDIGLATGQLQIYSLVAFESQSGQTALSQVPHDLVLDRSWVHGTAAQTVRRCVALNSASSAVIDSYLSDCHELGADSQAIFGYNGPGPFKIVNNYLEGAGENILFGGADPTITNLVPSDIEIRHNHFFKPLAWKGAWSVKNLFELKSARRMLVEGNIFDHNWTDGQNGTAILFKSSNQGGACTWCTSQDITFRFNLITNTGDGFNIAGAPDNPAVPANHIIVSDNVVWGINILPFDGDGRAAFIHDHPADVIMAHNTFLQPTRGGVAFGPTPDHSVRFYLRDNIFGGGAFFGVSGDGLNGGPAFAFYAPDGSMKGNVFVFDQATSAGYPVGNFFFANINSVGFTNLLGGDFHLSNSSVQKNSATDNRDPGADITTLNSLIAGVIVP